MLLARVCGSTRARCARTPEQDPKGGTQRELHTALKDLCPQRATVEASWERVLGLVREASGTEASAEQEEPFAKGVVLDHRPRPVPQGPDAAPSTQMPLGTEK